MIQIPCAWIIHTFRPAGLKNTKAKYALDDFLARRSKKRVVSYTTVARHYGNNRQSKIREALKNSRNAEINKVAFVLSSHAICYHHDWRLPPN